MPTPWTAACVPRAGTNGGTVPLRGVHLMGDLNRKHPVEVATYQQLQQLYAIVDCTTTYRDWDWLERWVDGFYTLQQWPAQAVIDLYMNPTYWMAVRQNDQVTMERIKDALLGR